MGKNGKKRIQKALTVIVWDNPNNRKVLLLKVTSERGGGWHPITGHVEPGESFPETALREAVEETGFSFTDVPRYLGLEHEFDGRFGPSVEQAFSLTLTGTGLPPNPTLDPKEHTGFQWCTPTEAMHLVSFPVSREAIFRATHPLSPLQLKADGTWWQDGEEVTHERTRSLLYNSVKRNPDGTYRVEVGKDSLPAIVEDTPFFISSYEPETGLISLLGGRREKLQPEKLEFHANGICYCTLENGERAKFLRSAYYTLAQQIEEENSSTGKKYFLNLLGRRHELRVSH